MAGSRDNLKRALIDTGEATPPRKQAAPYTSWCRVLLGSPGLIFYIYIIIIIIKSSCNSKFLFEKSTDPIALSIAYGPNILVIRDNQGMALSSPTSCI